ncbi:hypothetical protein R3P38DRAFT_2814149 [Favolaschia claudopus]|uniref:Uncharacterized protein n=1 Tax=Favolaschia claudopus TaxID=2862362 RepID=A0AAV9Z3F6_9AGAR
MPRIRHELKNVGSDLRIRGGNASSLNGPINRASEPFIDIDKREVEPQSIRIRVGSQIESNETQLSVSEYGRLIRKPALIEAPNGAPHWPSSSQIDTAKRIMPLEEACGREVLGSVVSSRRWGTSCVADEAGRSQTARSYPDHRAKQPIEVFRGAAGYLNPVQQFHVDTIRAGRRVQEAETWMWIVQTELNQSYTVCMAHRLYDHDYSL